MKQFKSRNGTEIGRFVANLYKQITGQGSCWFYVNITFKYISIKLDEKHLTKEQLIQFHNEMKKSIWAERFLNVYNSHSNNGTFRNQKVNVRFTKL